jgi:hypothetical protein
VRIVEVGAQYNNFCLPGIHGSAQQADHRSSRSIGETNPVGHVAVFVPHGGRNPEVVVKGVEQVEAVDSLQVIEAGRIRQADRH